VIVLLFNYFQYGSLTETSYHAAAPPQLQAALAAVLQAEKQNSGRALATGEAYDSYLDLPEDVLEKIRSIIRVNFDLQ